MFYVLVGIQPPLVRRGHPQTLVGGCGFVGWRDPPMCSRSVDFIPGLLRKNNMHEEAARRILNFIVKINAKASIKFKLS
ncbi:hypothetical protein R6Q59_012573 [Mikania micrantha]